MKAMIDQLHPTATNFVQKTRHRYGRLTAFRMGYVVGESGAADQWDCPYLDARSRELYRVGIEAGKDQLTRRLERAGG